MHEESGCGCEKFMKEALEFFKNKAWGKAKSCYERALAIHGDNEKAWVDLGRCHDRLGNPGKAFECYEEALHCNFLHKRALVDQGSLLSKNEKFKDALKCFDAALQMDPSMRTALDNRQKVLQEMIREGLLKAVPLQDAKLISREGKYCLQVGEGLIKSFQGHVIESETKALFERIIADFKGQGDLLVENGVIIQPRIFSAYLLASSERDLADKGDDLSQDLLGWLRADPIFEPAAGYPVSSLYQEMQQQKVKFFLQERGLSLNAWDLYTGEDWRKIINLFQEIVSGFTGPQKSALVNLGSLNGGQFVMTVLYLLGRCNEGEWARAIFSRTNDVSKMIGEEPVGPENLTEEARDMLIEAIIREHEKKCLVVKHYLESFPKKK
ncbi:MAG: tetratricopeptide repeat protein [Candidatus Omnitrophota bacterium]